MNTCLKHTLIPIAILCMTIHSTRAKAQLAESYYKPLGEFKYSIYDSFERMHRSPPNMKKITSLYFFSADTHTINKFKEDIIFISAPLSAELQNKIVGSLVLPISAEPMQFVTTFKENSKRLTLNDDTISDIFLSNIKYWDDPRIQSINPSVRLKRQIIYPHFTHISTDLSGPKVFMSFDYASPFFLYEYLTTAKPLLKRDNRMQEEHLWTKRTFYIWLTASPRVPLDDYNSIYLIPEHVLKSIKSLPLKQDDRFDFIPDSARSAKAVLLQNRSGVSIDVNEASVAATISADMNALKQNHIHYSINVPASGGYPLISYHYVIIPKKMRGKAEIADLAKFVHWLFNEGKATALKMGYYPLTPELQQWVENKIAELKNK